MSDIYEEDSLSITMLTFKCAVLRSFDNSLDARQATFKIELMKSDEVEKRSLNILMEKCKLWFSQVMNNSLIFSINNTFAFNCIFENGMQVSDNFPMVYPDDPTDELIAMVTQAKLNAFASGSGITFGTVEVNMTKFPDEEISTIYGGWAQGELPTMADWIGEVAYHTEPWWCRNDGSTIDIIPSDTDDLSDKPDQGFDFSFVESQFEEKKGMVVNVEAFTPKIIDCKNDPTN